MGPDNYHSDQLLKYLCNMPILNCKIHIWRQGLLGTEMLQQMDCTWGQEVPNRHPGFKHVCSNTPCLSSYILDEHLEFGRKQIVGPTQKSIALKKYMRHNFWTPEQLAWDLFEGTLWATQACPLVEKHFHSLSGKRMVDFWSVKCQVL